MRHWLLAVSLLVLALLSPGVGHAVTLIAEDSFEVQNGTTSIGSAPWLWASGYCAWSPSSVPCPHLDLSTDWAHTGSKSLKLFYNNQLNPPITGSQAIYKDITNSQEIWYRYYQRSVAMTYSVNHTKQVISNVNPPNYPRFFSIHLNGSRRLSIGVENTADAPTPYSTINLPANMANVSQVDGQVYCIEEHYKLNDAGQANGLVELFVDNVQTLGYYNRTFKGPSATNPNDNHGTALFSQVQIYKEKGNGYIYIDQFAAATTRVGGCTGAVQDTTPPSPVGLPTISITGASGTLTYPATTDNIGIVGYAIEKCAGVGCTPTPFATIGNVLSWIDTAIIPGTIYGYRVKGRDAAGNPATPSVTVYGTSLTTFPSVISPFPDNFARANNADVGTAYTAVNACQIVSEQVRSTTVNTRCYETHTTAPANDQWGQVQIKTITGAHSLTECVALRANSAAITAYMGCALLNSGGNTMEIREYTTGSLTTTHAGNATYTPTVGDIIKFDMEGTLMRLWLHRGAAKILVATATDASIASGRCGISLFVATGGSAASAEVDDLACGGYGAVTQETIAVDAVSSSAAGNTAATITWPHTVGTGTHRALAVCTQARDTSETDLVVTGVTYGGTPLTKAKEDILNSGTSDFGTGMWYLANPTSGAANIVITRTGASANYNVGSAVSLTGVDPLAPLDAISGGTGTGTTASSAITVLVDNGFILDCVAHQSPALTMTGAGGSATTQVNRESTGTVDSLGMSSWTQPTPGAVTMSWTASPSGNWAHTAASFKPADVTPVVEPTILSFVLDNTGADLVHGPTVSSWVSVREGTDSGLYSRTTLVPIAEIIAGRLNQTWLDGYDFVGMTPVNSLGVANLAGQLFARLGTLVNAADTTPIVMTQQLPTGTLNQGTTSTNFAINLSKPASGCKWDVSNTTYALMANIMSVGSLTASADTGAILSAGANHVWTQCLFINSLDDPIVSTSALDVTITVAAGAPTDTTAPAWPGGNADLTATPISTNEVTLVHATATDGVGVTGYQMYIDLTGTCTGFVPAGLPTTANPHTVGSLPPATLIAFQTEALDAAGNRSTASLCATATTLAVVDSTPPAAMTNLTAIDDRFTHGVLLGWDSAPATDGAVTATIEISPAGCLAFTEYGSQIAVQLFKPTLVPNTPYCARGFYSDEAGNRGGYSNVVTFTTGEFGLQAPRPRLTQPRIRKAP